MTESCSFHRSRAAHFQCQDCGTCFCEQCISIRETVEFSGKCRHYFCPACNLPAKMLSIGNMIDPFWRRLSAFFLYPLQPMPLILALVLACLGAVFPHSIMVRIAVWVVMVKYAFAALTTTGQGGLKAPAVTWDLINRDVMPVFKQYVLFAILGFGLAWIFIKIGPIGGLAFFFLVALALPMIIMLQIVSDSILHALNPMLFIPIITRIGWPYFLMYLFLFFLYSGPAVLYSYLPADLLPDRLASFLLLFFQQYYMLISYHLMGYVLLQYHEEIGYTVDYDFFMENRGGKKRKPLSAEEELRNDLAVLIKMGKYKEALDRLQPHICEADVDPGLSEKFLQLLKMAGEQENAAAYALRHLDLLVKAKKKEKALAVFAEIQGTDGTLPSPESTFAVAIWYQERKDFSKAMSTYAYFLKQFRKHPLRPEAYFELARLLHERGRNTEKAKEILRAIVKHYPEHRMYAEASAYLASVS